MSINKGIQLGLCCLGNFKRTKTNYILSRSMIVRTINEKGIEVLKEKIKLNTEDLKKMILWNEENGIKVMRMSSIMFPHISNPRTPSYTIDFVKDKLKEIGDLAKKLNHRLTFHPGQYNVVGTPNEKSFQHTIEDLSYHADVMDVMGLNQNSVMVVHGGGVYGDKEKQLKGGVNSFINYLKMYKSDLY